VARLGAAALARVVGLGDMHLAPTLQSFAEDGLRGGCLRMAVDMAGCPGMDSTFMGTLVGLSITLREHGGWLCVMNMGAECERLMRMLGVWDFVPALERPLGEPGGLVRLDPESSPEKRLETVLEAHRRLVEAEAGNRRRFGPFLEAVERELASRGGPPGPPDPRDR